MGPSRAGLFNETTPAYARAHPNRKIAVLRVDGNFYASYQSVMYALYEHVPVGGVVRVTRSYPSL